MPQDTRPATAQTSWLTVLVAWVLVGVPLLWGILITLRKAALLFK